MKIFITLYFVVVACLAGFCQSARPTGVSTLIAQSCPTLYPAPPFDLCSSPTATVVPVVHAPLGSTINYEWILPAGANIVGPHDEMQLVTYTSGFYTVTASNVDSGCSTQQTYTVVNCATPVGLKEQSSQLAVSVYPNPCADRLTVTLQQPGLLKLFDINARLLLTQPCSEGQNSLDLARLATGLYYLQVKTDSGFRTVKVIKE